MPTWRAAPSGTRLMLSTPPATTMSIAPHMTACAAKSRACWLEPHARLTVVPGMRSGQPAASAANLAMLLDWSPIWDTHPQITSSTSSGPTPVRRTSSFRTRADSSTGCTVDSPPLRFPTGVRTASTMTASRMGSSRGRGPAGSGPDVIIVLLADQVREPPQRTQFLVRGAAVGLGPDRGDPGAAERPQPVADHVVGPDERRQARQVVRHRLGRVGAAAVQPQFLDPERLGGEAGALAGEVVEVVLPGAHGAQPERQAVLHLAEQRAEVRAELHRPACLQVDVAEAAPGPLRPAADRIEECRRGLRDERAGQPPVGAGAGQLQPARRERRQVHGDLLLGVQGQAEHLALPAGPG